MPESFELYPATSFVPKPRGQAGRPSIYTDDIANRICELLIEGESLRSICDMAGMPNRATVLRWLDKDPDFAAKYAHARDSQADYMDDLVLETANACTAETAAADRVRINAYQWRAAKLKPKKYGDKGDDGGGGNITIQFNSLIQGVL